MSEELSVKKLTVNLLKGYRDGIIDIGKDVYNSFRHPIKTLKNSFNQTKELILHPIQSVKNQVSEVQKLFSLDVYSYIYELGKIEAKAVVLFSVSNTISSYTDSPPKIGKQTNIISPENSSVIRGLSNEANYAQKTYSNVFSQEGVKKYTKLANSPINTVDDLVNAINTGKINVADLSVDYIIRDGNCLILNTRTAQALTKAGIPRSEWYAVNRTGNEMFEKMLSNQLEHNMLTSEGIQTVRQSGKQ